MEKEAGILKREMKISLTFQKQAYAVFFVVILSLVRGITYSDEIGIALEAPMAILAFTFCADTYTQEIEKENKFCLQTGCDTGNVLTGCRSHWIWIVFSIPKSKHKWNGARWYRK